MFASVKNIIFDLGGVILNIDYKATLHQFRDLIGKDFDEKYKEIRGKGVFSDYESGKITSNQFRRELRKYMYKKVDDREIDKAWCAMLLDIPKERIEKLKELKTVYRTFLLSNTNPIHVDFFHQYLEKSHGYDSLEPFFEKVYFSHQTGMCKPDPAIFRMVIAQNKLNPQETLFIDDFETHIKSAKSTGIQTYLMKGEDDFCVLFA